MIAYRVIVFLSIATFSMLHATSLRDSIEDTLNNNPSIIASHINRDAYLKYVEQEEGDYLPTLDLDAYVEKSRTYNNPDQSPPAEGWSEKDGWNVALKLQYVLYDGGLTPAEVGEFQHRYNANKFKSIYDVENTIYETISTYVDLVSSQELLALAENNMQVHEKYLEIAQEKEEISGEVLETHQVNSKYHSVIDSYLEEEKNQYLANNLYKQLVGRELKGDICRPVIDETYIPKNVKEAVEIGLRRSFKVNEQIEKIKEQREKVAQEKAGFRPTITFELQGSWDDDLELEENGRQDVYRGRINLHWNLFDGGKTTIATTKEELFLKEEQKKLDAITAEVVEEINTAYYTYYNTKKRVENSKKIIDDNYNILMVYKKQLADGTRTFIDILNAESELYRSDIEKIGQEFDLYDSYYDLLNKLSMLSDVILMQEKQTCPKYVFTPRQTDVIDPTEDTTISDDLKDLFTLDGEDGGLGEIADLGDDTSDLAQDYGLGSEFDELTQNLEAPATQAVSSEAVATEVENSLSSIYEEPDATAALDLELETSTPEKEEIEQTNESDIETTTEFNVEDRLNRLYAGDLYAVAQPVPTKKTKQRAIEEQKVIIETPREEPKQTQEFGSKKYTINIATLTSQNELKEFINEYRLQKGAYSYRFGRDRKKIKLLYGEYDTVGQAKAKIDTLPKGLKEYVYVDNLQKHMALENKYSLKENGLADVIKGKYTINVATVEDKLEVQKYINEYKLYDPNYSYRFGDNGEKIKLIYGSFDTLKEAKKALSKLPSSIRNYVYIDSVQKHVELEKKYKVFN